MKRRQMLKAAAGSTLGGLAVTGTVGARQDGAIRAGIPQPFSGQYGWYGPLQWDIVQATTQIINDEHGGIEGRELKVIREDTDTTAEGAVGATRKLISQNNVHWIAGYTSATVMSIVEIVQNNEVPTMASVASTSNLDCVGGTWVFRAFPSDSQIGAAFAPAVANEEHNGTKDYREVGAFVSQQADKRTYFNALNFDPSPAELVKVIEFPPEKSSFSSEGSELANSSAEIVLLLAGAPQSVSLMTASFNAGYDGNWIGQEDQGDEQFIDEMMPEKLAEGGLTVLPSAKEDALDRRNEVREQLTPLMEGEPGVDWMNTYDGFITMLIATKAALVRDGELTRAGVREQIREIAQPPGEEVASYEEAAEALDSGEEINFSGLVSDLDFDEFGNVTSPMAVFKAEREGDELNYNQTGFISIDEINEYYTPPGC